MVDFHTVKLVHITDTNCISNAKADKLTIKESWAGYADAIHLTPWSFTPKLLRPDILVSFALIKAAVHLLNTDHAHAELIRNLGMFASSSIGVASLHFFVPPNRSVDCLLDIAVVIT